jgi:hypothetical protein
MSIDLKIISLYVIIPIIMIVMVSSISSAQFAGGTGTPENPYQIETVEQLQAMKDHLDKHFILMNDIDASATAGWNGGTGFEPVGGTFFMLFVGSLNGNGHIISELWINRPTQLYIGLFGILAGGDVNDLGLKNVMINGAGFVGGFAGWNTGTLRNVFSTGNIIASGVAGGLVGINNGGKLATSYSTCSIQTTGNGAGGLVGLNSGVGEIINSYAAASITGNIDIGGLVGILSSGSISNNYAVSTVNGAGNVGSLIGKNEDGSVSDCYWGNEMNVPYQGIAQGDDSGAAGLSTAQMLKEPSFDQWNFESVWTIIDEQTYPYLRWQGEPDDHNTPSLVIAPINLRGESGSGGVTLIWQAPSIGSPLGYNVYREGDLLNEDDPISHTEYFVSTIEDYHEFQYYVTAQYDDMGEIIESLPSNTVVLVSGFAGGDGSENYPYQIANIEHLQALQYVSSRNLILVNDIDASATADWNDGEGFMPIGSTQHKFYGSLDGDGHTIQGLTINRSNLSQVGLFGCVGSGSAIRNLRLDSVNVTGNLDVGALAGATLETRIVNCYVSGNISGDANVGGMVGEQGGGGVIENSHTSVHVDGGGGSVVGGLTGRNWGSISNSSSTGEVSANIDVGGLVGYNIGTITTSRATCNTGGQESVGGLVGSNEYDSITKSFVKGRIFGSTNVGGLVGQNYGALVDNYVVGDLIGTNKYIGGLVGLNTEDGSIINSYAALTTLILGETYGGIAGENLGIITDSFWNTEISSVLHGVGMGDPAGANGITTAGMIRLSSYQDWDFNETWSITDGETYPWLQDNIQDPPPAPLVLPARLSEPVHESEVETPVLFEWHAFDGAIGYTLQISEDEQFENIVVSTAGIASLSIEISSLMGGVTYYWRVAAEFDEAMSPWSGVWSFLVTPVTGVSDIELPTEFSLSQNYPNPFNPSTVIRYGLPEDADVRLVIYDMLGRQVAVSINDRQHAGYHEIRFDAGQLAGGMYIYRLHAGEKVFTRRMLLIK